MYHCVNYKVLLIVLFTTDTCTCIWIHMYCNANASLITLLYSIVLYSRMILDSLLKYKLGYTSVPDSIKFTYYHYTFIEYSVLCECTSNVLHSIYTYVQI